MDAPEKWRARYFAARSAQPLPVWQNAIRASVASFRFTPSRNTGCHVELNMAGSSRHAMPLQSSPCAACCHV